MGRPDKKGNKTFGMLLKEAIRAVDRPAWRQGAADTAAAECRPGGGSPLPSVPGKAKSGASPSRRRETPRLVRALKCAGKRQ